MGQQIIYCASCGTKILDRDFASRAAFRIDSRGFCKKCAPGALKSLPPDKMAEVLATISQAESPPRHKDPPRPPTAKALPAAAPAARRPTAGGSRTGPIYAAIAGAVAIVALLVWGMSGSTPPPPPAPPPPKESGERPPKVDREAAAGQALRLAREFRDANPRDLATQTASYERLMSDFKGTRAADDARRDLEELRRRAQEALESELKLLQEQARSSSAAEEFQKAIQALTEARGRRPEPAWTQGIDRTLAEIRALPEKHYPALKTGAVDARRQGAAAGVQEAKERVARWGLATYAADLDAALAAVPVSDKRPMIGKDLAEWEVFRGKYAVKDGMLEVTALDDQGRAFIKWKDELADYELEGSIQTTEKTYTEFHIRWDFSGNVHIEPGWHKFRVVARGTDVKVFVDDALLKSPPPKATRGHFGIFTIGALPIRIKDLTIRP